MLDVSKIYNGEKNHFTQFGECEGDHSEGWTVQDTLFQLRAQNSAKKSKVSVRVIAGARKWYSRLRPAQPLAMK